MRVLMQLVLAVLILAYPFVVYFGLRHLDVQVLASIIIGIAVLRLIVLKGQDNKNNIGIGVVGTFLLIVLAITSWLIDDAMWLKFYPITVSLLLLYLFAASLWTDKTMIQRFAELKEKHMSAKKKTYMRKLTKIWCAFFITNASISSYTLFYTSDETWMLYNGFFSYILIGLLIAIELIYRHTVVLKRTS